MFKMCLYAFNIRTSICLAFGLIFGLALNAKNDIGGIRYFTVAKYYQGISCKSFVPLSAKDTIPEEPVAKNETEAEAVTEAVSLLLQYQPSQQEEDGYMPSALLVYQPEEHAAPSEQVKFIPLTAINDVTPSDKEPIKKENTTGKASKLLLAHKPSNSTSTLSVKAPVNEIAVSPIITTIVEPEKNAFWDRSLIEKEMTEKMPEDRHDGIRAFLDYAETYRKIAVEEMYDMGIPASITLAQGILESSGGRSFLAKNANNHFGMKCDPKPGFRKDGKVTSKEFTHSSLAVDCIQKKDDHDWDHFEIFKTVRDCFHEHSQHLHDDRYAWMLQSYEVGRLCTVYHKGKKGVQVPYYAAWSMGLASSGYAASEGYADKLIQIIESYELWKFDYDKQP